MADESYNRLTSGYSGRILFSLSFGYLLIQFGRNALPPLLPAITKDLGLSPRLAGMALTMLTAGYASAMYPGGRLSDTLSRKTVLMSAFLITILGTLMISIASSYPVFVGGVTTFGVGAGLYWISLRALLTDIFTAQRGQAFGIQDAIGFLGPVVAAGVTIVILTTMTWQVAFLPFLVILALLMVLSHYLVQGEYVFSDFRLDPLVTGRRLLTDSHIIYLLVSYSTIVFSMQAFIGFLPTYLRIEQGFSPVIANVGFGVLFLGATTSMLVAGYLGDKFNYTPVAFGGILVCVFRLGFTVFGFSRIMILVGIFAFGVDIWAFPPVVQSHLMTRFPENSMGAILVFSRQSIL